jgi:hypothetical protein
MIPSLDAYLINNKVKPDIVRLPTEMDAARASGLFDAKKFCLVQSR